MILTIYSILHPPFDFRKNKQNIMRSMGKFPRMFTTKPASLSLKFQYSYQMGRLTQNQNLRKIFIFRPDF